MFLVLTALVVDAGDWFVHKRQLQNRADAGAFAAGVDYAANWAACVQDDDPALKAATAAAIAAQARRYAGDPAVAGPVNTEIANQAKLNVVLNSTSYDGGDRLERRGRPVLPPRRRRDLAVGRALDGRQGAGADLPSLFGSFGLPLSRNGARARIEIHPAVSDNGFIPLAIPETEIVEGAGALLRRVREPAHAAREREPEAAQAGSTRPSPAPSSGGLTRAGRRSTRRASR